MDVQDLPPLNALSLELATVLDEISGVSYQQITKAEAWRKKKYVLSGYYSREPSPESPSSYASERMGVSDIVIDPGSIDRISGFNILSATLVSQLGWKDCFWHNWLNAGSVFPIDMGYVDKVGGFDHIFHAKVAVEPSLPMDSFNKLAGFYQIPSGTQDKLSGHIALNQVSRFVDRVSPMLSSEDVSALHSILERLNVKSEDQIIHLKHPDLFANERSDTADTEIVWITSEVSDEKDEFRTLETASFVSDTFSVSEYAPKEWSDDFHETEIIWITASEELTDTEMMDQSSSKTETARSAVTEAVRSSDYDDSFHKEAPVIPLDFPVNSSDQEESEFIWITSPEEVPYPYCGKGALVEIEKETVHVVLQALNPNISGGTILQKRKNHPLGSDDLIHVEEEPITTKAVEMLYEDQSHSQVASSSHKVDNWEFFDFAGEEIIVTPLIMKSSDPDDVSCLVKKDTAVKPMEKSDKDQSSSSFKQPSSPATVSKLHDSSGEEIIITPVVKKSSDPDDVSCLVKEDTAVKPMEKSDKEQSSSSFKQPYTSSSPATVSKLCDSSGEEIIITPVVKDESPERDWNLSYKPWYPAFVNARYWKRASDEAEFDNRKKLMQSGLALDSELCISDPDQFGKKNKDKTGHKDQLGFKNSLKEVVLHLDHSDDFRGGHRRNCVAKENLFVPYTLSFYSDVLKNIPLVSSMDDSYIELKPTTNEKSDILNLENSSRSHVIHDTSDEMCKNSFEQQLTLKVSRSTSAQDFTPLESSHDDRPYILQHDFPKEDDIREAVPIQRGANELFSKEGLSDHMVAQVGKISVKPQHGDFQDDKYFAKTDMTPKYLPEKASKKLPYAKKSQDEPSIESDDDSQTRSQLQAGGKGSSVDSKNLSVHPPVVHEDFIKPEDPSTIKTDKNVYFSDRTYVVTSHPSNGKRQQSTKKRYFQDEEVAALQSSSSDDLLHPEVEPYIIDEIFSSIKYKPRETLLITQPESSRAPQYQDSVSTGKPSQFKLYDFCGEEVIITPVPERNYEKGRSDDVSLRMQQYCPMISNNTTRDPTFQASCDKFCQVPSEEVFPASSLLVRPKYSSYGSHETLNESSSTDGMKKRKSVRFWMRKIFKPKKLFKKRKKGNRN